MPVIPRTVRGGFTVIEFIVSIAVVMVLLTLLVPVVNNGMRRSREVSSMNNIRQIYLGLLAFHGEFGSFPQLTFSSNSNSFGGEPFWNQQIMPYLGYDLEDYEGKMPSVFLDPTFDQHNTIRGDYGVFYHNVDGPIRAWGNASMGLGSLVKPSRTPLIATSQQMSGSNLVGSWFVNTHVPESSPGIAFRNDGRALVTFADGHTAWFEREKFLDEYLPFKNE